MYHTISRAVQLLVLVKSKANPINVLPSVTGPIETWDIAQIH
jgi:hypothetical protein